MQANTANTAPPTQSGSSDGSPSSPRAGSTWAEGRHSNGLPDTRPADTGSCEQTPPDGERNREKKKEWLPDRQNVDMAVPPEE
eukprot:12334771-Prorocentrum_lima.AAC.1